MGHCLGRKWWVARPRICWEIPEVGTVVGEKSVGEARKCARKSRGCAQSVPEGVPESWGACAQTCARTCARKFTTLCPKV